MSYNRGRDKENVIKKTKKMEHYSSVENNDNKEF